MFSATMLSFICIGCLSPNDGTSLYYPTFGDLKRIYSPLGEAFLHGFLNVELTPKSTQDFHALSPLQFKGQNAELSKLNQPLTYPDRHEHNDLYLDYIFDNNFEENDLFPLALSCRFFRQKQKELVARTMQSGPGSGKHGLALRTDLSPSKISVMAFGGQPASADYLRFCSKEKVSKDVKRRRDKRISALAAFHGHLPLVQELLKPSKNLPFRITRAAGESSLSQSLFVLASDHFLCFSSSQRREANWRPCSG